jgi:hypothetical protein
MTDEKKPLKIEFAPGCFDNFEGSQEELDEFIKEITTMFTELTPEELEARSRPLSEEDIDELPDEVLEKLDSFLNEEDHKRKLQ